VIVTAGVFFWFPQTILTTPRCNSGLLSLCLGQLTARHFARRVEQGFRSNAMTRALPFSKASIKRRCDAAREAGLFVTAITPDGTVLTAVDRPEQDDAEHNDPKELQRLI
jgi:hypothetical protein